MNNTFGFDKFAIRPWGEYTVLLDNEYCKVKQINVKSKPKIIVPIPP